MDLTEDDCAAELISPAGDSLKSCLFKQTTPTQTPSVVLQTGANGSGKLFVEDVSGSNWKFGTDLEVFARQINPELQALIEFRPLNLLDEDYGMAGQRFVAVFCRNVMIYFDKATQYRVLRQIVPLLAPDGRLYAGHSESFHHASDLVTACGRTVYRAARGSR